MVNIWLTADTHFNHKNIIAFCNRPFDSLRAMNEHLVRAWNETVRPDDVVMHLGDVAMGWPDDAAPILGSLHGRKLVVLGNHDTTQRRRELFAALGWRMTTAVVLGGVLFRHKPEEPPHPYKLVVHGHTHGCCMLFRDHFDVGVDVGNWQGTSRMGRPLPVQDVLEPKEEAAVRIAIEEMFAL